MSRKNILSLAVLAALSTVLMTACGTGSAAPAPAPAAADQAGTTDGALPLLSGTARSNNAQADTGDWATRSGGPATAASQKWVQLSAGRAGDLNPVVVNGADLTLYRFDKDTASPSASNCNGDCATTWPPVTIAPGGKIFIDGLDKSTIGVVKRADGSRQVTIAGWPVYRFAKDKKAGDTLGQGVGGTWFGITPDGKKAGAANGGGGNGGQNTGGGAAAGTPASSATMFDDANFSDSSASEGVSGPGCQNLARPGVTSSVSASGSLKLWSGKDCTGRSVVINGNVADLSTIGLDNAVTSVKFG